MNTPPPHLDVGDLLDTLRAGWQFEAVSAQYAALGFGSHHWAAVDSTGARHFVTVDDLSKVRVGSTKDAVFARLSAAFETARRLWEQGLDFVVAPLPDVEGRALRRLDESFSVAVFPLLDGQKPSWGEYRSDAERRAVLGLVERLHDATAFVGEVANKEDFQLPCRTELELAFADLGRRWTAGPFSERARQLLRSIEPDLMAGLRVFDSLVNEVRSDSSPWVITHGEPHAGNIIWTSDGPRLVDWDTALIAPAARDLWMLEAPGPTAALGTASITFYRLWWDLAEIAGYVTGFRRPHDATADAVESWRNFQHYARIRERWGEPKFSRQ